MQKCSLRTELNSLLYNELRLVGWDGYSPDPGQNLMPKLAVVVDIPQVGEQVRCLADQDLKRG